ncbi:MAG TPA: hypothetical protein VK137_17930, partial [Planctomycetaceae bacterium]|nr:hypothetical protein [Planctomycetaceae bacterium]
MNFGVRCVSTALDRGEAAFFLSGPMKYQVPKVATQQSKAVLTHRTGMKSFGQINRKNCNQEAISDSCVASQQFSFPRTRSLRWPPNSVTEFNERGS